MYNATPIMTEKVVHYLALKAEIQEMVKRADGIADSIKAIMERRGIDEMGAGEHVVTYKNVTTSRLNPAAVKKLMTEEDYAQCVSTSTTKRFAVK